MSTASSSRSAYILLTLSSVAFGGTWVTGKLAVAAIPPMLIAASRFAIASALLWGWARLRHFPPRRLTARDLPLILLMGLSAPVGGTVFFLYGLRLAPASDGALIVPGIGPILTTVLAWPVLQERISRGGAIGFATALLGLLMIVSPGGTHAPDRLRGDVLFLIGAVCWALYPLAGKPATKRFTPVMATLYAMVTAALVLFPFAAAESGWFKLAAASPIAIFSLLYLGILGTALAFVMYFEGVSRIGVIRSGAFAYLIPVCGVIFSVIFLGERLTALTIAGGALVLFGLWLVQKGSSAAAVGSSPARDLS